VIRFHLVPILGLPGHPEILGTSVPIFFSVHDPRFLD